MDSLWVDATDAAPYVVLGAVAAVTSRVRLVAAGAASSDGRSTCARLAPDRLVVYEEAVASGERWIHSDFPGGRAAWRQVLDDAAAAGATGVVVPNDPRLLDLLRNADVVEDRSDLNLATG